MSKHMQLTVHIRGYYDGGFKAAYPAIARALSYPENAWAAEDPSLFDIVKKLDKLLYEHEGNKPFRKVMRKYRSGLFTLHKDIQDHIANWRLAEADQDLYRMEDIFDDMERDLDEEYQHG
jgi:hypothetical protein